MKNFKKTIAGFEVTDQNYKEVTDKIKAKYGICPALQDVVMLLVENDEEAEAKGVFKNRKAFIQASNEAIELIGYKPSYFNSQMRKIC